MVHIYKWILCYLDVVTTLFLCNKKKNMQVEKTEKRLLFWWCTPDLSLLHKESVSLHDIGVSQTFLLICVNWFRVPTKLLATRARLPFVVDEIRTCEGTRLALIKHPLLFTEWLIHAVVHLASVLFSAPNGGRTNWRTNSVGLGNRSKFHKNPEPKRMKRVMLNKLIAGWGHCQI